VALRVTLVEELTTPVVIVKGEEIVAPEATVTLDGTEATAEFELESAITAPPGGAG